MLFIATCIDKPNSLETRLSNRPAHLAFLSELGPKVRAGGALLADDGQSPVGSLLILEGESAADIRAMLAKDPYALAGLFDSVAVRPWRQAVGQPLT